MSDAEKTLTVRVNMIDLEEAFEVRDSVFDYYLDTETGRCVSLPGYAYDGDEDEAMEADRELVDSAPAGRFIQLSYTSSVRPSVDDARVFAAGVEDPGLRRRMEAALARRGRGVFRDFLDLVHSDAGERERWFRFSREILWRNIAAWLESEGVRVIYETLPRPEPRTETRQHLLAGAVRFVARAKAIAGVERIALIGSIVTPKREPNDVDLIVTIASAALAKDVATAARKLQGHAGQRNRGADVFLASSAGDYLGRTCPWRECAPGIRQRCEALHCGDYIYDDLQVMKLDPELIAVPPLEIWPRVVVRGSLPDDVREAFEIES